MHLGESYCAKLKPWVRRLTPVLSNRACQWEFVASPGSSQPSLSSTLTLCQKLFPGAAVNKNMVLSNRHHYDWRKPTQRRLRIHFLWWSLDACVLNELTAHLHEKENPLRWYMQQDFPQPFTEKVACLHRTDDTVSASSEKCKQLHTTAKDETMARVPAAAGPGSNTPVAPGVIPPVSPFPLSGYHII